MAENRIPLKTDDPNFNRHDFVQNECGIVEELTVEITLAEYREFVTQLATEKQEAIRFMFERDRARQDLVKMEFDFITEKGLRKEEESANHALAKENTRLRGEVERLSREIDRLKREAPVEDWTKEEAP